MKDVDCNALLERLWAYLDGEVDEAEYLHLEEHIARCLGCRHHADFEVRLREIIQTKCRGEQAPARLREELRRLLGNSP
jgi:anti-sigma factor (TIGR02949 family)